jgi:hypothetical protein
VDPAEYLNEWYEATKTRLMWWGGTWACVDSILTAIQFLMKILIVVRNLGKNQLNSRAIFRFVFMPGHELINLFPRRSEDPAYGGSIPHIL